MSRTRAALIHLGLSALVAALVFLAIVFVWFPDVLFEGAGGRELFLLIVGVDVTLGPLITFIVYKAGKKGLAFDLSVIAALQVAALAYGLATLWEARPVYIVFAADRFELARAHDITEEELERARPKGLHRLPLTGPRVMGARLPTDPDEQFALSQSALQTGVDIQGYPRYFVPYEEVRAEALAKAHSIERLRRYNVKDPAAVDRELRRLGRAEGELRYLPMRAGKRDLTVLLDARTGDIVSITTLLPWQY